MFHDPNAFADLSRRMREPQPAPPPLPCPSIAELVQRLDRAIVARQGLHDRP